MRPWGTILLKSLWGGFLLVTSAYCLLAYLPYTYVAFIKAPAYAWMPWMAAHHALLFAMALAAFAFAYAPARHSRALQMIFVLQVGAAVYLGLRPVLPSLQDDTRAFAWSLAALLPLLWVLTWEVLRLPRPGGAVRQASYSTAIMAAVLAAGLHLAGAQARAYAATGSFFLAANDLLLAGWSVLSHVVVALLVVSLLNLLTLAVLRSPRPGAWRRWVLAVMTFFVLRWLLLRFLNNVLSLEGAAAQVYGVALAAVLTLAALPLAVKLSAAMASPSRRQKLLLACGLVLVMVAAPSLPSMLGDLDWNGVVLQTAAAIAWIALAICLFGLRRREPSYRMASLAAVLALTVFGYGLLQMSSVVWARRLGATDDEITRQMDRFAGQDASFRLAQYALGRRREEACGELCRILRQHSNLRDFEVAEDLALVERLAPTPGPKPHIFLFVVDSLRPDYLGAYNPRVDFTPHLDELARDSVVFRNAFTQYAGTTLSEPAIWAGAMLLHAHYMQPFARLNSLQKLARADGYQLMVSYDTVLRDILSTGEDLIKLDAEAALWNQVEVCGTVEQAVQAIDRRSPSERPLLFFSQPMNLHQFAANRLPGVAGSEWQRPGFNRRVSYALYQVDRCLGRFFAYLKQKGMYDNSIIVVTSDHGDATGELGRYSHSLALHPEVMRVPLIVRLPPGLRQKVVHDAARVATLTDITPSLYALLGHGPIRKHALLGRPLFASSAPELAAYDRGDLLLASDVRAAYGLLSGDGRFLYTTYDSPAEGHLYDLVSDPQGQRDMLTPELKRQYDQRVVERLRALADFYGYRPGMSSLFAAQAR